MPKYTRSELITLLPGLSKAHISVAINRDKALIEVDGLIDDSNPINKFWIDKRRQKAGIPEQSAPATTSAPARDNDDAQPTRNTSLLDIKTKAQIAKYKEEIELLKAKKEKLFEEIIPVQHAEHLLVAQSEALKGAWLRATETLIKQFFATHHIAKEEQTHWRRELTDIVNETVQTAAKDAKTNLRRLARDFAGKKGKGERQ